MNRGSAPRTIMIGRNPSCDAVLPHETVSRFHAELVIATHGALFLTDRRSTGGTWIARGGRWARLDRPDYVEASERVRFGEFETDVQDVLRRAGVR